MPDAELCQIGGRPDTVAKIVAAPESAGVKFVAKNRGGLGVRLRKAESGPIATEYLNASNDD